MWYVCCHLCQFIYSTSATFAGSHCYWFQNIKWEKRGHMDRYCRCRILPICEQVSNNIQLEQTLNGAFGKFPREGNLGGFFLIDSLSFPKNFSQPQFNVWTSSNFERVCIFIGEKNYHQKKSLVFLFSTAVNCLLVKR